MYYSIIRFLARFGICQPRVLALAGQTFFLHRVRGEGFKIAGNAWKAFDRAAAQWPGLHDVQHRSLLSGRTEHDENWEVTYVLDEHEQPEITATCRHEVTEAS